MERKSLEKGILVGANKALEWLLPWWWERYSACNVLPVAFADFGLSDEARDWCKKRGDLLEIEEIPEEMLMSNNPLWAKSYGASYETARQAWFKKPLALTKTPFELTLWCDLDCEILQNLEGVFSMAKDGPFLAIAKEIEEGGSYPLYNGGVILYRKSTPLLEEFAKRSVSDAAQFWGDDRLLSYLIDQRKFPVEVLSPLYNWRINRGVPAGAFIVHWVGEWGKNYIKAHGGIQEQLKS